MNPLRGFFKTRSNPISTIIEPLRGYIKLNKTKTE